jgi:hypothetical protein
MGREMIAKANPVVKGEKLNKIWKGYCCNFTVWLFVSFFLYPKEKKREIVRIIWVWDSGIVVIISCYVLILVK